MNAARLLGRVAAAAMKADAGKYRDAAGGTDYRDAGIIAEIADEIVGAGLGFMVDPAANTGAFVGQHRHGAVGLGHVVERAPATQVTGVLVRDIAGILMP